MKDSAEKLESLRTLWQTRGITIQDRVFHSGATMGSLTLPYYATATPLPTIRCNDSESASPDLLHWYAKRA